MVNVGLIFTVLTFTSRGIQGLSDYYIEDAYVEKVSPEYLDPNNTDLGVVWINSTLSGVYMTAKVIKRIPMETTAHFNLFAKSMGEYNTPSGLSISMPYCKAIGDSVLTRGMCRAMNISGCPIMPGTYSVDEWHAPPALMPAFFPGTQYRSSFVIKYKKTVILQTSVIFSLY